MTRSTTTRHDATSPRKHDRLATNITVTITAVGLLFLVLLIGMPARAGLERDFGHLGDLILLNALAGIYCITLAAVGVLEYWIFAFMRRHAAADVSR